MKKILSLILFALLLLPLEGQIGRYPFYTATISDPYCPEYRAVYNAMTTKPGLDTAAQQNIMFKRIVDTCDLDLFYVFAQRTNADGEAFLNWIDPTGDHNCTDVNTVTFTKYHGITSDGTNYVTTNYNPSSEATHFSLNSATVGTVNQTEKDGGLYTTIGLVNIHRIRLMPGASDNFASYMNNQTPYSTANTTTKGFTITTRRASDDIENYLNMTSLGEGTNVSGTIPDGDIFILCYNNAGTPNYFFTGEISIAFVGEGFSDEQEVEVVDAIEDYLDYLGIGVIP